MDVQALKKNVYAIVKTRPIAIRKNDLAGYFAVAGTKAGMINRVDDGAVELQTSWTDVSCPERQRP